MPEAHVLQEILVYCKVQKDIKNQFDYFSISLKLIYLLSCDCIDKKVIIHKYGRQ